MSSENPTAGEGPVLLDIGGDVGALIVTMPESTRGLEVEIRPAGATAAGRSGAPAHDHGEHEHDHDHGHSHDHGHPHDHGHGHTHAPSPYPHVGVVERRTPDGTHLSLVYPDVVEGEYELCPMPGDEVVMTATVSGGRVTEAVWPR